MEKLCMGTPHVTDTDLWTVLHCVVILTARLFPQHMFNWCVCARACALLQTHDVVSLLTRVCATCVPKPRRVSLFRRRMVP